MYLSKFLTFNLIKIINKINKKKEINLYFIISFNKLKLYSFSLVLPIDAPKLIYCWKKSFIFIFVKKKKIKINKIANNDPINDFLNTSTPLFLSKKEMISIKTEIKIIPYAAGVCFDKKDKHKRLGIKKK